MALEQSLRRNFFSSWLQTQKMETVGTSARTDCSLEHGELLLVFADVMIMGRGLHHVAGVSWHHTCAESSQGGGSARSAILSVLKRPATRQVIDRSSQGFRSDWQVVQLVDPDCSGAQGPGRKKSKRECSYAQCCVIIGTGTLGFPEVVKHQAFGMGDIEWEAQVHRRAATPHSSSRYQDPACSWHLDGYISVKYIVYIYIVCFLQLWLKEAFISTQ